MTMLNLYLDLQAYGSQFVQKVKHRHVLARGYFTKLPDMKDGMRSKMTHLPLPRAKERVITVQNNKQPVTTA